MPEYEVEMIHKMRSYLTVQADSEGEAKQIAYEQSFDEEDWEEMDTEYVRVRKVR